MIELKSILESILFSAQQPLTAKELKGLLATAAEQSEDSSAKPFKKVSVDEITTALEQLVQDHAQAARSYRLACVGGAWQFFSEPEYAPWIKALVGHKQRPTRLSQPALETLAIIAYRQPLTRAEIEQIRGVTVDAVLQTLVDRGLVEQVGRAEVPGRPMTYGTTALFLEYFGLRSLESLPAADELRRVVLQKPDTLLTVDPGLATAPPADLKAVENPPAADPALAGKPSAAPGSEPDTGNAQQAELETRTPESEG